jgi:undecaprenyl-diphosphatase
MSLIETIENIDQQILLTINGAHTDFIDKIMFYLSEKWTMIPFYLLVIYFIQKFYGWKTCGYFILFALLLVAACDLTATHLFKNVFERYRPSHHLILKDQLHFVNDYRGGTFGFYSSHASNMMALAIFTGYFLYGKVKHYSSLALTLVFLIGISRIYLGVHYPSDVMVGFIMGSLFATIFIFIYIQIFKPIKRNLI